MEGGNRGGFFFFFNLPFCGYFLMNWLQCLVLSLAIR